MCMVVLATAAGRVTATCALSMREKLHVPVGWCSSGLSAKEYEYTPGYGEPEWWLKACTWLKYLPFCSLKRSWPLRTNLKVSSGPAETESAAPSSDHCFAEPDEPTERSGAPVPSEIGTWQLPYAVGLASRTTEPAVAALEVKFQCWALEEPPSLKHHTSSLIGWL